MNDFITTAEAARLAGVGVSSIKRWADQEMVRAIRTPGGHRRVDRQDLLRFLAQGEPAGNGAYHQDHTASPSVSPLDLTYPADSETEAMAAYWANAVLRTDVYELQALLLTARSRYGAWHRAADQASRGLREIGRRWSSGEISVMDEHLASERLAQALTAIGRAMPNAPNRPRCLLACADGEMHTLGLSFLQLCVIEAGWEPVWAGAITPVSEICRVARDGSLRLVALSASSLNDDNRKLASLAQRVGAAASTSGVSLVVGGEGAWPDALPYGIRLSTFESFTRHIRGLA